jgi:DNA-binding phage protein
VRPLTPKIHGIWGGAGQPPRAGHLCTPEHLEADLALLTARQVADFLDPEARVRAIKTRRDRHIADPETIPDSRTDPSIQSFLHSMAETGNIELLAEMKQSAAAVKQAEAALYQPNVTSTRESLWRAMETVALKGIKSVAVTVEDSDKSSHFS